MQCRVYQCGIHVFSHCPSHYFPREQIQNDRQIQPTFHRVYVCEITDLFSVGDRGREVLVEVIGCQVDTDLATSGHRMPASPLLRANSFLAHQTLHTVLPAHNAFVLQASVDAWAAIIGLATHFVFHVYLFTNTRFSSSRRPTFSGRQE